MKESRRKFLKRSGVVMATAMTGRVAAAETREKKPVKPFPPDPALADPIENMKSSYDFVVIGSGYGGSIAAARLAKGKTLCVLERGREWRAGDFPDTLKEAARAVRTSRSPHGLYEFHLNKDMDVVVGSALGGTSIINSNVAMVPDPEVFDQSPWPEEIRRDRDSEALARYYDMVSNVLETTPYPDSWIPLRRLSVHKKSSEFAGAVHRKMQLAVNFDRHRGGLNQFGVTRNPCSLCGNCSTGCNYKAKNFLTANYLPLAKRNGAEIYTQIEVESIERVSGGYTIHYKYVDSNGKKTQRALSARSVILAAGVLGSTKILMRSRETHGLQVSQALGQRFSANGDLLGVGFNSDTRTDILGRGSLPALSSDMKTGPVIVSAGDARNRPQLRDRVLIEDGSFPSPILNLLRTAISMQVFPKDFKKLGRVFRDWVGLDPHGALNHSMLYLGIGHDEANGSLTLTKSGRLKLNWPGVQKQHVYKIMSEEMKRYAQGINATHLNPDPRSLKIFGKHLMTVHPLGGCPMGSNVDQGVVDHLGRVFDSSTGGHHENLYVLDGSIIPTALGVNPFLTISALAERAVEWIGTQNS